MATWGDSIAGTFFPKQSGQGGTVGTGAGNWSGGGARPFYDTGNLYGAPSNPDPYNYTKYDDYMRTDEGRMFARDSSNFDAVLERRVAGSGSDPFSLQGKFLSGMLSKLATGYKAVISTNPLWQGTFDDYVQEQLPILQRTFLGLTADQQGQNVGRFIQPMRTISRGE